MKKNAAQHWNDGAKAQQPEIDSLRTRVSSQDETIERLQRELAEAVALLRRAQRNLAHDEACDLDDDCSCDQITLYAPICSFLARVDGAKCVTINESLEDVVSRVARMDDDGKAGV